jgi:hypothetical protein
MALPMIAFVAVPLDILCKGSAIHIFWE